MSDELSLEYETCIFLKSRVATQPKFDFEGSFIPPIEQIEAQKQTNHSSQVYLFSLNLLTRFTHILTEKKSLLTPVPSPHKYSKENLLLLQKHSIRLL